MNDTIRAYDGVGRRVVQANAVSAADRLIGLKKKGGKDFWPVLDEIIKIWIARKPKAWRAHVIEIRDVKGTRKERKFASSKDKVTGGALRYIVDVPSGILRMLRCLYSAKELPFDKKFWRQLHFKYPLFRVAEKV